MTDAASNNQPEALEAAQHVVDEVTSYEYSGDPSTIESQLLDGFGEAGVDVPADELKRLVQEIDNLKKDENAGTPQVRQASSR